MKYKSVGKYKSDKYKNRGLLIYEIMAIIRFEKRSRKELIEIKNLIYSMEKGD